MDYGAVIDGVVGVVYGAVQSDGTDRRAGGVVEAGIDVGAEVERLRDIVDVQFQIRVELREVFTAESGIKRDDERPGAIGAEGHIVRAGGVVGIVRELIDAEGSGGQALAVSATVVFELQVVRRPRKRRGKVRQRRDWVNIGADFHLRAAEESVWFDGVEGNVGVAGVVQPGCVEAGNVIDAEDGVANRNAEQVGAGAGEPLRVNLVGQQRAEQPDLIAGGVGLGNAVAIVGPYL